MHMADAMISPAVGGAMWAAAGAAVAMSSRALSRSSDRGRAPLMGVLGAFVFATQMINFTIPGTGSSGHFVGGLLVAVLLGRHAALLVITAVLAVQAHFFADGGLLALGANIVNMGVVPCLIVYPLLVKPLIGGKANTLGRAAIVVGAVIALQLGALGVVAETTASGITELPFSAFMLAMLPVHLAIGVVEGLITLAVVAFVERSEPAMLGGPSVPRARASGRMLAAFAVLALIAGGVLSWFASANPDGLEWSVAQVSGQPEVAEPADSVHAAAARLQNTTALLPDYAFPAADEPMQPAGNSGTTEESSAWGMPSLGTSVSGLVGGLLTLMVAGFAGWALGRRPVSGAAA